MTKQGGLILKLAQRYTLIGRSLRQVLSVFTKAIEEKLSPAGATKTGLQSAGQML